MQDMGVSRRAALPTRWKGGLGQSQTSHGHADGTGKRVHPVDLPAAGPIEVATPLTSTLYADYRVAECTQPGDLDRHIPGIPVDVAPRDAGEVGRVGIGAFQAHRRAHRHHVTR